MPKTTHCRHPIVTMALEKLRMIVDELNVTDAAIVAAAAVERVRKAAISGREIFRELEKRGWRIDASCCCKSISYRGVYRRSTPNISFTALVNHRVREPKVVFEIGKQLYIYTGDWTRIVEYVSKYSTAVANAEALLQGEGFVPRQDIEPSFWGRCGNHADVKAVKGNIRYFGTYRSVYRSVPRWFHSIDINGRCWSWRGCTSFMKFNLKSAEKSGHDIIAVKDNFVVDVYTPGAEVYLLHGENMFVSPSRDILLRGRSELMRLGKWGALGMKPGKPRLDKLRQDENFLGVPIQNI